MRCASPAGAWRSCCRACRRASNCCRRRRRSSDRTSIRSRPPGCSKRRRTRSSATFPRTRRCSSGRANRPSRRCGPCSAEWDFRRWNSWNSSRRGRSMADFSSLWTLEPGLDFLNHGSFGACPRTVLEVQSEFRARMERQPLQFLARDLEGLLDTSRAALAEFVHADADDLAFVPNATTGVNTVVRSLDFEPGDEIVTTTHGYNACLNALRWTEKRGVRVVYAQVPWPVAGPWQVVESVMAACTDRTKLALIDHVTSPTGLIFPVVEIVRRLNERGVDTLVDGARVPGMLPLDLRAP